ncbi:hypothetical protein D1AOALGA4SA_3658, partial [Olavius algarvensis Delta 1 endosymbiont]
MSLKDAPRRDLNDETKTFVSITIFIWYYISYHDVAFKWNIVSLQNTAGHLRQKLPQNLINSGIFHTLNTLLNAPAFGV